VIDVSENDEDATFSASEQVDRINRRKKKQLENIDFTLSPEEIEKRKREATETEFQTD